jgi:hypothetical protein
MTAFALAVLGLVIFAMWMASLFGLFSDRDGVTYQRWERQPCHQSAHAGAGMESAGAPSVTVSDALTIESPVAGAPGPQSDKTSTLQVSRPVLAG